MARKLPKLDHVKYVHRRGRVINPLDGPDINPQHMRMNWTDFLTAGERRTLQAIKARHAFDQEVKRRIYDRCRKRMDRKTKRERETNSENHPVND